MTRSTTVGTLVLFVVALCAAAQPATSERALTKADYQKVVESPETDALFKEFLAKLPTVTLGTQNRRTYYVLEGDLLLTEEQVRAAIRNYSTAPRPALSTGELKIMMAGGKPVYWPTGQRRLTYAIDRTTFRTQSEYDAVVRNMKNAGQAWSDVCPKCGLKFVHVKDADAKPSPEAVTFIVTFDPQETGFIAASFFPNDPQDRRVLIITPSYFTTRFDRTGVLRHEIGHINGYRHEHIEGIPGCFREDADWKPLTAYDSHSVMHYFCGGGGTLDLRHTDIDKVGHRKVYAQK